MPTLWSLCTEDLEFGCEKMTRAEMAEHYQITNYKVDKICLEILGRLEKYFDECDGLFESVIKSNDTVFRTVHYVKREK